MPIERSAPVIKTFKNGWTLVQEKTFPSGLFAVLLRNSAGEIVDKVRCDDSRMAREYASAFGKIAKAAQS